VTYANVSLVSRPFSAFKDSFIHSEELQKMYPDLSPKEREDAVVKAFGAVFIIGIGYPLKDGLPHDGEQQTTMTGSP